MVSGPHVAHEAQSTSQRIPPFPLAVQTSKLPRSLADGLCPSQFPCVGSPKPSVESDGNFPDQRVLSFRKWPKAAGDPDLSVD